MSSYPGNYAVKIQTGTVDIVPDYEHGRDLPVIARLPVRMGESDLVKIRAYQMAAAPGMVDALINLIAVIEKSNHPIACSDEYRSARHALIASRVPEKRQ